MSKPSRAIPSKKAAKVETTFSWGSRELTARPSAIRQAACSSMLISKAWSGASRARALPSLVEASRSQLTTNIASGWAAATAAYAASEPLRGLTFSPVPGRSTAERWSSVSTRLGLPGAGRARVTTSRGTALRSRPRAVRWAPVVWNIGPARTSASPRSFMWPSWWPSPPGRSFTRKRHSTMGPSSRKLISDPGTHTGRSMETPWAAAISSTRSVTP